MKKIIILTILLLPGLLSAKAFYDFQLITPNQAALESDFEEFDRVMSQVMNGNLSEAMNVDFIQAGAGFLYLPYSKDGILVNSDYDYLAMPFAHLGISLYNITLFGRIYAMTSDSRRGTTPSFIAGGGLAYNIDMEILNNFPVLTIEPALTYHNTINFGGILNYHSFGLHVQGRLNLEKVQPYVEAGTSLSLYETDIILSDGTYYQNQVFQVHSGIGIRVFILFYQFDFLPGVSHSFGASLRF